VFTEHGQSRAPSLELDEDAVFVSAPTCGRWSRFAPLMAREAHLAASVCVPARSTMAATPAIREVVFPLRRRHVVPFANATVYRDVRTSRVWGPSDFPRESPISEGPRTLSV
jgi:hypothetical protein